jgi:phage terminase large subunit-like protein
VNAQFDFQSAATAAGLLAERRALDGLVQFQEGPPGILAHQNKLVMSEKAEAWLFGANRSGKTDILAYILSGMLRFGLMDPRPAYVGNGAFIFDRAVKVWAISLTAEMGRNILQPKMFDNKAGVESRFHFIPDSEISGWNITTQTLRLKNGSIAIFKTAESGRDTFQGADIDIAGFDEVPPEEVYKETTMRVGGGRRLVIRGAATILPPAGEPGGVSWMYSTKVKPWKAVGGNKNSPRLDIFTAGIRDNPTIDQDVIADIEARIPPGSPEHRIRILGELLPSIGGSLCYAGFLAEYHHEASLAPIVEGTPRPQVLPFLPLRLSCDFNPENGVWTVCQKVGRKYNFIDEITLERSDTASMTYEFRSRFPWHGSELWVYGDTTGRRAEAAAPQGESNFHVIAQHLTGYPCPIRFILPSVNPPVKDRVAAVNLILRPPTGEKRFAMAPHMIETTKDLEASKWTAAGKIDKRGGRRSDGADTIGYLISTDEPTRAIGPSEAKQVRSVRSPSYTTSARAFPASHRGYTGRPGRFLGRRLAS